MRVLRALLRAPLVLLHTLVAIPLCAFLLGPTARRIMIAGKPLHERAVCWWARVFCRILGVRIAVQGTIPNGGALIVANHVSFLDISVIHARVPASFIAKGEIGRWPLVGWFSARADTLFHRRGSAESLRQVGVEMRQRLEKGIPVALFPEAGTGQLSLVRPFHGRLFQPAIDAGVPVVPLAIDYHQDGRRLDQAAFEEGETFMGAVLRLLGESHIVAHLGFCDPIESDEQSRKALASRAREAVVKVLHDDPIVAGGTQ